MKKPQLWIIGGTSESVQVAQAITQHAFPGIITVTTPEAVNLYPALSGLSIQVGKLSETDILAFIDQYQIVGMIDASHPFAQVISAQAMHISQTLNIPYLRYERATVDDAPNTIRLESFTHLVDKNYLLKQRVLLTLGANNLSLFQPWQTKATLFARILPRLASLEMALQAGFTGDRLIALRPPYTQALELALWQQWQISLVVSKASGEAGGEAIKQQVATQLGIPLIVIDRPRLTYLQQTQSLTDVLQFCRECFARID